ncbi:MAG: transposase [Armatimonadetes bacterium]|nr:transposase [Armatimonadota bacterium]
MSVRAGKVLDRPLVGKLLDGRALAAAAKGSYDSGANHALLAELGIRDGVCYRWGRQRAEWARGRVEEELTRQRWRIEGKFAEQKRWHGLGRARYRGLRKVTFQALMVALVVNVKRLVKILADKGLLGRLRFGRRLEWIGAAA